MTKHIEPDSANLDHWRVDPSASDEPWPAHYWRPLSEPARGEALEDELDAANAKLARIERLLNTGILGIDDAQLIREVLADD